MKRTKEQIKVLEQTCFSMFDRLTDGIDQNQCNAIREIIKLVQLEWRAMN